MEKTTDGYDRLKAAMDPTQKEVEREAHRLKRPPSNPADVERFFRAISGAKP